MGGKGSIHNENFYRCESGKCCTLHFFNIFLSFHLSRVSFYITVKNVRFLSQVNGAILFALGVVMVKVGWSGEWGVS